jgi:hypothetical protein
MDLWPTVLRKTKNQFWPRATVLSKSKELAKKEQLPIPWRAAPYSSFRFFKNLELEVITKNCSKLGLVSTFEDICWSCCIGFFLYKNYTTQSVWSRYWLQDWFLAGMRQVYTWYGACINWYKVLLLQISTKLVLV